MSLLIQQIVNGLGVGSQYALWAVGYGMVFQVLGLMHFAHGDTLLLTLYFGFLLVATLSLPIALAAVLLLGVGGLLAIVVWLGIYRPLVVRRDTVSAFIAALGAAFVLRSLVIIGWGSESKAFPKLLPVYRFELGGILFNTTPFLVLGITVVVVIAFTQFLKRSKYGQAIVYVGQDRETSALMGIPVGSTITLVYALSGVIGVIGALMFVTTYGTLNTDVGFFITLKAFVAAMIGGVGRIEGAVLGGLLLGILEALIVGYGTSVFVEPIVFAILGAILLIRPSGFLGRQNVLRA